MPELALLALSPLKIDGSKIGLPRPNCSSCGSGAICPIKGVSDIGPSNEVRPSNYVASILMT